jgi:peptidoglycan/LPS O-acetylase OafA/YrhL
VLSSRPAVWLGQISYSLYLWQQLFFVWDNFRSPAMGVLQSMPLRIVMARGCASISRYCLEKPMIELGRRIIRRLNTRAPAVPSVLSLPIDAAASVVNRSL